MLTQYQQTTYENILAKGEIAHDEQFLHWSQCFQLYLTSKLSFVVIFQVCVTMFSKSSAAYVLYVEKGFPHTTHLQQTTLKT